VSRESTLKHDLQVMREAIDNYTVDKQRPPQSLQDLVEAGYLRELPIDPITLKRDWAPQIGDITLSPKGTAHGIYDVHSSSGKAPATAQRSTLGDLTASRKIPLGLGDFS
jgi:general secretion pathway protein G